MVALCSSGTMERRAAVAMIGGTRLGSRPELGAVRPGTGLARAQPRSGTPNPDPRHTPRPVERESEGSLLRRGAFSLVLDESTVSTLQDADGFPQFSPLPR